MKRFLAILLCFALCFAQCGGLCFAEEAQADSFDTEFTAAFTLSDTELALALSITDGLPDVFSFTLTVDFDRTAFSQGSVSSPVDSTAQWGTRLVIAPGSGSVDAGATIAVLHFGLTEAFDACSVYSFTIGCEDCFDNNYHDIIIPELSAVTGGHDWGAPSYVWADDNSSVTASRVCGKNPGHTETETVTTSSRVTTEPGCETPGVTTYTATFTNPAFETQTKSVTDIAPLDHDWNAPSYVWADDDSSVTASRVCKRNASHAETETAAAVLEILVAPTFDSEGQGVLRATFVNPAFETQTKDVVLERLTGFAITVEDYTKGGAVTDLDLDGHYFGEVGFTVTSEDDLAVTVILRVGTELTVLRCTTDASGAHHFTIPDVQSEVTVILAFKGDTLLDGKVNMRDSLLIKKHAAGTELMTGIPLLVAETDGTDKVNMRDSLPIKKQSAGTAMIAW